MDIGAKEEPGRELKNDDARQIGGGYITPVEEDPPATPGEDPFGGGGGQPVDP